MVCINKKKSKNVGISNTKITEEDLFESNVSFSKISRGNNVNVQNLYNNYVAHFALGNSNDCDYTFLRIGKPTTSTSYLHTAQHRKQQ